MNEKLLWCFFMQPGQSYARVIDDGHATICGPNHTDDTDPELRFPILDERELRKSKCLQSSTSNTTRKINFMGDGAEV